MSTVSSVSAWTLFHSIFLSRWAPGNHFSLLTFRVTLTSRRRRYIDRVFSLLYSHNQGLRALNQGMLVSFVPSILIIVKNFLTFFVTNSNLKIGKIGKISSSTHQCNSRVNSTGINKIRKLILQILNIFFLPSKIEYNKNCQEKITRVYCTILRSRLNYQSNFRVGLAGSLIKIYVANCWMHWIISRE